MAIKTYINRIFNGQDFTCWYYVKATRLDKNKEVGSLISLASIEISDDSIIAIDTGDLSPRDYIFENQYTDFILDASVFPQKINTVGGLKNVFYAKNIECDKIYDYLRSSNLSNKLILNVFKENDKIYGGVVPGVYTKIGLDTCFVKIKKNLKNSIIPYLEDTNVEIEYDEEYDDSGTMVYEENCDGSIKDIGSIYIQLDILETAPYYYCKFKVTGFTENEITSALKDIYDNTTFSL